MFYQWVSENDITSLGLQQILSFIHKCMQWNKKWDMTSFQYHFPYFHCSSSNQILNLDTESDVIFPQRYVSFQFNPGVLENAKWHNSVWCHSFLGTRQVLLCVITISLISGCCVLWISFLAGVTLYRLLDIWLFVMPCTDWQQLLKGHICRHFLYNCILL